MTELERFCMKQVDILKDKKKRLQTQLEGMQDCEEKELMEKELYFTKQELTNYLSKVI